MKLKLIYIALLFISISTKAQLTFHSFLNDYEKNDVYSTIKFVPEKVSNDDSVDVKMILSDSVFGIRIYNCSRNFHRNGSLLNTFYDTDSFKFDIDISEYLSVLEFSLLFFNNEDKKSSLIIDISGSSAFYPIHNIVISKLKRLDKEYLFHKNNWNRFIEAAKSLEWDKSNIAFYEYNGGRIEDGKDNPTFILHNGTTYLWIDNNLIKANDYYKKLFTVEEFKERFGIIK